jgi:flagellar hook-length control protein FliK
VTSAPIPVLPQQASSATPTAQQPGAVVVPGTDAANPVLLAIPFSALLSTAVVRDSSAAALPAAGVKAEAPAAAAAPECGDDPSNGQADPVDTAMTPDTVTALASVMAMATGAQITVPMAPAAMAPQQAGLPAAAATHGGNSAIPVSSFPPTPNARPTNAAAVSAAPAASSASAAVPPLAAQLARLTTPNTAPTAPSADPDTLKPTIIDPGVTNPNGAESSPTPLALHAEAGIPTIPVYPAKLSRVSKSADTAQPVDPAATISIAQVDPPTTHNSAKQTVRAAQSGDTAEPAQASQTVVSAPAQPSVQYAQPAWRSQPSLDSSIGGSDSGRVRIPRTVVPLQPQVGPQSFEILHESDAAAALRTGSDEPVAAPLPLGVESSTLAVDAPAIAAHAPLESAAPSETLVTEPTPSVAPVRLTGGEAALAGSIALDLARDVAVRQADQPVPASSADKSLAVEPPRAEAISTPAQTARTSHFPEVSATAKMPASPVSLSALPVKTVVPEKVTAAGSEAPLAASWPKQPEAVEAKPIEPASRREFGSSDPVSMESATKANASLLETVVPEQIATSTDARHTNLSPVPQTSGSAVTQPPVSTASTVTVGAVQTISQAASSIAASTQDNQQSADRNVATERSTTMSLGSVVAGSSETKTAQEAAPGDTGAEHGRERRDTVNPDKTVSKAAAPESKFEPAPASAVTAPTEPPLKAAAPNRPDAPAPSAIHERVRVVEQVAQKLDTMRLGNGRQEMTVHLRPDHLGDLRVTIIADRHEVVARIVAETAAARDAVMEGRDHLSASLEHKGYSLQGLDVSLNNGGNRPFVGYQQPQDQPFRQSAPTMPSADAIAQNMPLAAAPSISMLVRASNGRLDYEA